MTMARAHDGPAVATFPPARPGTGVAGSPPSRGLTPQLIRFVVVGVASTAAYALLYLLLHPLAGAFAANALALLITAVANTALNRRLTFGVRGRSGVLGDYLVGLGAFVAGLALTSGALAGLHAISDPARRTELVVLMLANAAATLLRFVALRFRLHSPQAL